MKTAVKAAVILFAAITCAARFIAFKYENSFSPGAQRALLLASVVGAVLCLLGAAVWVILERKSKKDT